MTCETTVYGWRIRPARRAPGLEITVRPPRDVSVQELARALIHACPRDPDESSGRRDGATASTTRTQTPGSHRDAGAAVPVRGRAGALLAEERKGQVCARDPKGVIQQRVVARAGGL